jgi:hypothetical protein
MKLSPSPLRLAAGLLVLAGTGLSAQSTAPRSSSTPSTPPASSQAAARAAANRQANPAARAVIPDPDLFDGSGLPAEARPDKGMLAEFELPGSEERPETMEAQKQGEQQGQGGGGGPQGQQSGDQPAGAGGEKPEGAGDPNAKAEGIAVAKLEVDENSAPQQAAPPPKPREVSMGDKSQQISTAVAQQNVVGSQPAQQGGAAQNVSSSQQYEKGAASGKSSGNNQNKGLEKGRNMPAGL